MNAIKSKLEIPSNKLTKIHTFLLSLSPLSLFCSECCCKSDKTQILTTLDPSNISPITGSNTNAAFNGTQPETTLPPNYDEIDPPPSYATLFPGNKAFSDTESSSTSQLPANSSSNSPNQVIACLTADLVGNGNGNGNGAGSHSNSNAQQASAPVLPSSSTSS